MVFQKGQSGNPGGRPKQGFGTVLHEYLSKEVALGVTARQRLAEKAIAMGLAGDLDAIKWIADRVDGKVKDETGLTGELVVRILRDRT